MKGAVHATNMQKPPPPPRTHPKLPSFDTLAAHLALVAVSSCTTLVAATAPRQCAQPLHLSSPHITPLERQTSTELTPACAQMAPPASTTPPNAVLPKNTKVLAIQIALLLLFHQWHGTATFRVNVHGGRGPSPH